MRAPEIADIDTKELRGLGFMDQLGTVLTFQMPQRIQFKIEKHLQKIPNQGEITVTNLAESTRDLLITGPTKIRLEAGYEDGGARFLFLGDTRFASDLKEPVNWQVKMQLADGGRAYANARHNKSYATGTPLAAIIGDMCRSFGVPLPPEISVLEELHTRIPTGEVVNGLVADELSRLLDPLGMEWSLQGERLQIMRADAIVPGVVRVISQDDGLIDSPEIDPPKIRAPSAAGHRSGKARELKVPKLKLRHLLYPELVPGEKFELRSRAINGMFRIDVVTHEGDSHGKNWETKIEARSVSGDRV
jgi:hypothetical protein